MRAAGRSTGKTETKADARTRLPSVDRLLAAPEATALIAAHGRPLTLEALRAALDGLRAKPPADDDDATALALADAAARLARLAEPSQRRVFNLTGTVLHTNLGRALLPEEAIEAVAAAMREPSNLEYDLASGRRGERDAHVASWLVRFSGAEAATVVNNNAAAVLLVACAAFGAVQPESGIGFPRDVSEDGWRVDWLIQITSVFIGILFVIMCVWMGWSCLAMASRTTRTTTTAMARSPCSRRSRSRRSSSSWSMATSSSTRSSISTT